MDDSGPINSTGKKEESAINSLPFYQFIIESLPIGILTVNPKMMVTSFNPWAQSLTGHTEEEALGRYCGDILRGGMCRLDCPLRTAIDQRKTMVRMETTIQTKTGQTIPVRMHTAALLDNDGILIGAVEAFQDVSSLKAAEREKDNLISMFAHDMKSSLTIIGGFVLRLLRKAVQLDEEKNDRYLEIIQKETSRLDSLISDFLEFARLQTGKLKLNFQSASLDKLLLELFEAYQSKVMQSGIDLKFSNYNILPVIVADPDRLRRVFTNLLDNAFKFSQKGGEITIAQEETPDEIMITIADQGVGIDKENLPYIFDIFHRGKDAKGTQGAGVGLATVKAIVEGHGGRILVQSKPGKGSAFTVILPKTRQLENDV